MRPAALVKAECPSYSAVGPYSVKDYCCEEYDASCRCLVMGGGSTPCKRFLEAVAPQDAEAQAEYISALEGHPPAAPFTERTATCKRCGRKFKTTANRTEYCSDGCRETARKEQYRESKKRSRTTNSEEEEKYLTLPTSPQLECPRTA